MKKSPKKKNAIAGQPKVTIAMTDSANDTKDDRLLLLATAEDAHEYVVKNADFMGEQYKKTKRFLGRWKKELLSGKYGEVTGFGIELYSKRGLVVMPPQYCIVVSLANKAAPKDVRLALPQCDPFRKKGKNRIVELPQRYPVDNANSVRVKVVEATCKFAGALTGKLASGTAIAPKNVVDPLRGGSAISRDASNEWGTLGIVFPTKNGVRGITCSHVFSNQKTGSVLQPPFSAIGSGTLRRVVGSIEQSIQSPSKGVDASLILPSVASANGVLGIDTSGTIKMLVADSNHWNNLSLRRVAIHGARTGIHKFARIIDVSASINIDNKQFGDLIKVHADPSSSTIVDEGDSGSALLLHLGGSSFVWIGIVVGMIDNKQLVACKLPMCMSALGFTQSSFNKKHLWDLL